MNSKDPDETLPWTGSVPDRDPLAGIQCTAHNRLGERCKRYPVRGALVCNTHGGGTPIARKAARERLLCMVEPAFRVLLDCIESRDENTALKAAKIILDRAGFGPQSKVTVVDERDDLSKLTREELTAKAQDLVNELRANASAIVGRAVDEDARQPPTVN